MGFVILSCFYKWPTIYFFYILPWHNSLWYSIDIKLLDIFVYLTFLFIRHVDDHIYLREPFIAYTLCVYLCRCVWTWVRAHLYSRERAPVPTLTHAKHVQSTESYSSAGNCKWQPVCLTAHTCNVYSSVIWSHMRILNQPWKPNWLLDTPTGLALVRIFIVDGESLVQIRLPENLYVSMFKGNH